jgi:hypothetical protein
MKKIIILSIVIFFILTFLFLFTIAQTSQSRDPIKPVCCVTTDGTCQDIGIKQAEQKCGTNTDFDLISDTGFCNQQNDCNPGCCKIKGKMQKLPYQRYECIALCVSSGVCTCTGNNIKSCTWKSGDFDWSKGQCPADNSYKYIIQQQATTATK